MKRLSLFVLTVSMFWACAQGSDAGHRDTATENAAREHFTVDVPVIARENARINPDAALCYANLVKGVGVMVIEEAKNDFPTVLAENGLSDIYPATLEGYNLLILDGFGGDTGLSLEDDPQTDTLAIGGLPCLANHFRLLAEGIVFVYDLLCIEGRENYYQLVFFCQEQDTARYAALRRRVLHSFRENPSDSAAVAR